MIKKQVNESTYDLPEGNFRAILANVATYTDHNEDEKPVEIIRFTFELEVPGMRNQKALAAKSFDSENPKLQRFVERWIGKAELTQSANGSFDPETLEGIKADITIQHIKNPGFKKPFCNIVGAYPLGTLTLTTRLKEEAKDI